MQLCCQLCFLVALLIYIFNILDVDGDFYRAQVLMYQHAMGEEQHVVWHEEGFPLISQHNQGNFKVYAACICVVQASKRSYCKHINPAHARSNVLNCKVSSIKHTNLERIIVNRAPG